ncbi:MAG TPA: DegT/DnrJ/EryC1/StrS family aminotransferase [Prolixibacteraceae bacterium]
MGDSIKMVDLFGQYRKIKYEIDQAIEEVISSSSFINGKPVEAFAGELADYLGVKNVVPCANGTDALQIAYQTLDLKPGDEVLMPAFNYVASAEAAALLGLKPVFVDVWEDTFNINENLIKARITNATKAIVVVHLFGQSANMEPIFEIARRYGLKVIEDNAQSLGSTYQFSNGEVKRAGTMGDINTYSFFPTKNLGCFGDGGAMATNNQDLAQKATMISRHGQGKKYSYEMIGCNSRLDTIQAAILSVKLRNIDSYLQNRIEAGNLYNRLLENMPNVIRPTANKNSKHTFNQYVIKLSARDQVKELLKAAGVPTMIYYPSPIHLQKAYAYLGYKSGDFPIAEKLCNEVLALPVHTEITSQEQEYIVNSLIQSINSL